MDLWFFNPYFFRFSPQQKKHTSHPSPPIPEVSARLLAPPSPVASPRCLCPAHWAQPPGRAKLNVEDFPGEKKHCRLNKYLGGGWDTHLKNISQNGNLPQIRFIFGPEMLTYLLVSASHFDLTITRIYGSFLKVATCLIESCSCFLGRLESVGEVHKWHFNNQDVLKKWRFLE